MATLHEAIQALEPRVAGNPTAMLGLARLLQRDGQAARALAMCRAALALAPGDRKLAEEARALINGTVPSWHFSIIRDNKRNAAYDSAIRRAVRPGSRVLDIGTGTGLLALMAARAGAAEVIACEVNPVIAEKAEEIVRQNGYAGRIRVIAKHSRDLDVDADLGGRVDVIVSEIVSNDLLSQNILPVHERAVRDLLKPDGQVIPARGAVRVALAHWAGDEDFDLGAISGFDLSAFKPLAPPLRIRVEDPRLSLRSEPADLLAFDFASRQYCPPSQAAVTCRSSGGRVNGIAQWLRVELDESTQVDEHTHYENRPRAGFESCWGLRFHPFDHPIDTQPDDEFRIGGAHDRSALTIWCESAEEDQLRTSLHCRGENL